MKYFYRNIPLFFVLICLNSPSFGNIIEVGPNRQYKNPSAVTNIAQNGDTIAIDAAVYTKDVAYWKQDNLHFMGVGGMAHLKSEGRAYGRKAIWVIGGNNISMEYIEFSECKVGDKNGAGIRMEGTNLRIKNCYFHHNENGILAGNNDKSTFLIEHSEFGFNGAGDGFSHNIYINHVAKLTIQYSYFHHAKIGHQIKSRAHNTFILYNRIMDEKTGNASRIIDIPNGGYALVMGNLIMQGTNAENSNLVGYGLEGLNNPGPHAFNVYNNTFVNERHASVFIQIKGGTIANIINNVFVGKGTVLRGTASIMHHNTMNSNKDTFKFVDYDNYDYHIDQGSTLIEAGTDQLDLPVGISLDKQYKHPNNFEDRPLSGAIDIGAYEYRLITYFDKIEEPVLSIYPNPVQEYLIINSNKDILINDIINCNGNKMTFIYTESKLNIQHFPSGIYFIGYTCKGISKSLSFMKL